MNFCFGIVSDFFQYIDPCSNDNTDDSDDLGPMTFPCCICETIVFSPKELGMHILEKHCDDTESNKIDYEITF